MANDAPAEKAGSAKHRYEHEVVLDLRARRDPMRQMGTAVPHYDLTPAPYAGCTRALQRAGDLWDREGPQRCTVPASSTTYVTPREIPRR